MTAVVIINFLCSVFFFCKWRRLWKDYDILRIEYGRLYTELKQLERRSQDEIL